MSVPTVAAWVRFVEGEQGMHDESAPSPPSPQTSEQAEAARAAGAPRPRCVIVGLGASAGGLEAFETFFAQMPPDSGMALAQIPESARYDSLLRSAIATGLVDHILPVEAMPDKLIEYTTHLTARLRQDPTEVEFLFKDLLIGVTRFFRDPEASVTLAQTVIPQLFTDKVAHDQVRVGVSGCVTGEEAYSLAILVNSDLQNLLEQYADCHYLPGPRAVHPQLHTGHERRLAAPSQRCRPAPHRAGAALRRRRPGWRRQGRAPHARLDGAVGAHAGHRPTEQLQRIRTYLGWRLFDEESRVRLTSWSNQRVTDDLLPSILVSRAEDILRAWQIVAPARSTLEELVASVTARVQDDVYTRMTTGLRPELLQAMDNLLQVPLGARRSILFQLKKYPAEASYAVILRYMERYHFLRELGVGTIELGGIGLPMIRY